MSTWMVDYVGKVFEFFSMAFLEYALKPGSWF